MRTKSIEKANGYIDSKWRRWAPWLILAASFAAYQNSFHGPFLLDGRFFIENDPAIREFGSSWSFLVGTSRPITRLTFAINYALGGIDVFGFHVVNFVIHSLAALTLFGLIRKTFQSPRFTNSIYHDSAGLAMSAALLWAIHPIQTESVTYIFQRAESLMGLLYLLTLYTAAHAFSTQNKRGLWQILALICSSVGMGAKPVMVTAPLMVLVYDRFFWALSWRNVWSRRRFYALLALTWIPLLVIAAQPNESRLTTGTASIISPWAYAGIESQVIVYYLRLALWPVKLVFDYGSPLPSGGSTNFISSGMVIGLLGLTLWMLKRKSSAGFLGIWFFLTLCPTSSFFPVADVIVEHRMYLALASVILSVCFAAHWLVLRFIPSNGLRRLTLAGALLIAASLLCAQTINRNNIYRERVTIWSDTVQKRPLNARAYLNLGNALMDEGKLDEAAKCFQTALSVKKVPWKENYLNIMIHSSFARALMKQGKTNDAILHFKEATKLNPHDVGRICIVGSLLASQGELRAAVNELSEGLELNPDSDVLHQHLGAYLEKLDEIESAIDHYKAALAINDKIFATHLGLGRSLVKKGLTQEGLAHLYLAESLAPQDSSELLESIRRTILSAQNQARTLSGSEG